MIANLIFRLRAWHLRQQIKACFDEIERARELREMGADIHRRETEKLSRLQIRQLRHGLLALDRFYAQAMRPTSRSTIRAICVWLRGF